MAYQLEFKLILVLLLTFELSCTNTKEGLKENFIPTPDTISLKYSKNFFKDFEYFEYSVKYGFIHGGQIKIYVDTNLHTLNHKPCYKIELIGYAKGIVGRFNDFHDKITSFVDTGTLQSVAFVRDLKENKYVKKDITYFDRENLHAICFENKINYVDTLKTSISSSIQDILSAYFLLRNLKFNKNNNDTITVDVFWDNQAYNLKCRVLRSEKIYTEIGEKNSIVIYPILPDNQLLRGETPIQAWISNDEDKIPLKVKAKLLAGSFEVNITKYAKRTNTLKSSF